MLTVSQHSSSFSLFSYLTCSRWLLLISVQYENQSVENTVEILSDAIVTLKNNAVHNFLINLKLLQLAQ